MKNLILGIATLVALSACGPRDVAVDGTGGMSPAGASKITVFENNGERSTTCPVKFVDETAVRSPENLDTKIYSGNLTAAFGAGDRNCYRVGSVVDIANRTKSNPNADSRGQVRIVRVELVPVTQLTRAHAKALAMASLEELTEFAEKELESAKKAFNPKGMASITYFEFIEGSEPDGVDLNPVGEIVVINQDGERPATCPKDFTDSNKLSLPEAKDDAIFAKKITAALGAGDRNCFKVGSIVVLQNKTKENPDAPVRAELKILKVELIPRDKMNAFHAKALGIDLDDLNSEVDAILAQVKFDHKDMVHLTYFQLVEAEVVDKPAPAPEIDYSI